MNFLINNSQVIIDILNIDRFSEIEENDGIKLLNVSPSNSGIYECEVSNIDEVRQRQMLIVFCKYVYSYILFCMV